MSEKSYGRESKDSFASRAFDAVVLGDGSGTKAHKAASTMKRWGNASFTSTRCNTNTPSAVNNTRKRKMELNERPAQDSMFDDPFSFDSDNDDAPKKPERGIGYKPEEPPAKLVKSTRVQGSSKLKKDENNEEKDTMKKAPTTTYSRGLRKQTLDNGSSKQLSLSSFFTPKPAKKIQNSASTSQLASMPRKFFTSSEKNVKSEPTISKPSGSSPTLFDEVEQENPKDSDPEVDPGFSKLLKQHTLLLPSSSEKQSEDSNTEDIDSYPTDEISSVKAASSPASVISNDRNSNGSLCDSMKWDNRPMLKVSSLDRNDKGKDSSKPMVRRLLTSPKKVMERCIEARDLMNSVQTDSGLVTHRCLSALIILDALKKFGALARFDMMFLVSSVVV